MKYLFDTFCWVERFQKGAKYSRVVKLMEEAGEQKLVSSVSLAEISAKLWAAGRSPDVHHVLGAVTRESKVVGIDEQICDKAGEYFAKFHAKHNIGLMDCIIAASALVHGATVVTGDPHFKVFSHALVL